MGANAPLKCCASALQYGDALTVMIVLSGGFAETSGAGEGAGSARSATSARTLFV